MTIYDNYFRSVILYTRGDIANGATVVDDLSYEPLTKAYGGAMVGSNTQSKFGLGTSLYFDGSDTAWFNYGLATTPYYEGDFTIETWIRPASMTTQRAIFGNNDAGTTSISVQLTSGGSLYVHWVVAGVTKWINAAAGSGITDVTWAHIALCRRAGVMRLFINGVSVASVTSSDPVAVSGVPFRFGSVGYAGYSAFHGHMQDIRVTPGVGRYTGDGFSPLSWTQPFGDEDPLGPPMRAAYLDCPMPTLSMHAGGVASGLTISAPTATVFGGANGAVTFPAVTLVASGNDATSEAACVLSSPTLAAYGGANAALTLSAATLAAAGTGTNIGRAALIAPMATVTAGATAESIGTAALTFGNLLGTYDVVGYSGAVISVTIGGATVAATGSSGGVGRAALRLPLYELVATGTANRLSYADLLMPAARLGATAQAWLVAPSATLVAIGTATVVATYEAYSLNLNHKPRPGQEPVDEMTRYTNYPFDRIVRYQGSYFGVAADGLYLLEGTTDYASPTPTKIPWSFRTAISDMGTAQKKGAESIYFGGSLGHTTVTMYVGEDYSVAYRYRAVRGADHQNYRQALGRGAKARYFAFGVSGEGALALDDLDFRATETKRRI